MIHACGAPATRRIDGKPTRTYDAWKNMNNRCSNPRHPQWADYGGRGIHACAAIRTSYEALLVALGGEIAEGLTLDRTDNTGGYWCGECEECEANGWPLNLRIATYTEQVRNRRNTVRVEYRGEVRPLADWCAALGLDYRTVYRRLARFDWTVPEALGTPLGGRRGLPLPEPSLN